MTKVILSKTYVPHKKHNKTESFYCKLCKLYFQTVEFHKRHKDKHQNVTYQICFKRLSTPKTMKLHMQTHSNGNADVCDICSKRYKIKHSLKPHIKQHKNKIYICIVCNKTYNNNSLTHNV